MILYTRDINGVLRIAETEATPEMLVNQETFAVEIGKLLGVKIVKPVLGVVDSNTEKDGKLIKTMYGE